MASKLIQPGKIFYRTSKLMRVKTPLDGIKLRGPTRKKNNKFFEAQRPIGSKFV